MLLRIGSLRCYISEIIAQNGFNLRENAHELHEFSRIFHLTVNYKSLAQNQRGLTAGYVKHESILSMIDS